jgi:transposase-like protein
MVHLNKFVSNFLAKIIREQLNVHIMAIIIAEDVESAKKDFHNDPEQKWKSLKQVGQNLKAILFINIIVKRCYI